MSGGSFNYLCFKEPEEVLSSRYFAEMVAAVEKLAPGSKAALDGRRILDATREFYTTVAVLQEGPWQAVEWYYSNDYSKERALEVIAEYEERGR